MANIYDSANGLEQELRELDEFKALEAAFATLQADEAAFALFKEFQEMQQILQEKQMNGEAFTDEDADKAQEIAMKVQQEALINSLMEKEQAFSVIINDLNRIIMTPIRDLYQG
ncbi:YlbF family regulator [Enterococcus sp. AZ103]|uniref:YlbF family regulator n=1 Tax=Enterococcus sp. AZ103 TaxID=2774628 RepID=UPI003F24AED6